MKKVILVMAVAALFAFTGTVMASPPVPPPEEGFKITTDTNIVAIGQVTENEGFTWHWGYDLGPGNGINNELEGDESNARIRYMEEFNSNNTLSAATQPTTFDKKFLAESHPTDTPNMSVDKVIGYTSDGAAGSVADFDDKVAIEVVSAGGNQIGAFVGIFKLCPWVIDRDLKQLPATNEGIAMGSSFDIPNLMANGAFGSISANIESDAEVTNQVTLGYDITATGAGRVNAAMLAKLYDGVEPAGGEGDPPLASVATYTEFAEANGLFAPFHKKMDYAAYFTKPSPTPEIIDQILP